MRKSMLAAMLSIGSMAIAQDSLMHFKLEEVSIISSRAKENDAVSQTTIHIAEFETEDFGQDAALLLEKLSPSIISFSDAGTNFGNYQSFRLRGMDQSRINVTMNGIPLNDMLDQGVFFSNVADFNNSMQSVQVQRGVGTSGNGVSSYAGSVNYQSINLQKEKPEANLRLSTGSFASLGLSAEAHTGKRKDNFAAYVRASRMSSEGYKYYSGSNSHSFFFSGGYLGGKHQLKMTAFSGKTQNHQSYLPVLKSDIDRDPRTNYNSANDKDDFEQDLAQLQYTYLLKSSLILDANMYYTGARGFFPFDIGGGTQFNYGIRNNQYGLAANLHKYGQDWEVHGGIHGYVFNRQNETNISPDFSFPYYKDKSTKNEISAFVKGEKQLNNLTFFADLQVRNVTMAFESDSLLIYTGEKNAERTFLFFNPKIGLSYRIDAKNDVYASFGRTGREPTRTDIFLGASDAVYAFNAASIAEPDSVQAEFVNDFELGFRHASNKLRLAINGFYMDFQNEISAVGGLAQNSYFVIRQNVASSQRYGVEFNAEYEFESGLTLSLMTTYLQSNVDVFNNGFVETRNRQHVFAPNWIVQPQVSYTIKEKVTLGFNGRYLSKSYMELSNNSDYTIPESLVLNAFVNADINRSISVGLFVNNITNALYFTDGAPVDSDFDGNPEGPGYRVQAPRNVFAKVNFRF